MQRAVYKMNRTCLTCGSDKTYIRKGKYAEWYNYTDGYICKNCYEKLINRPRYFINNYQKIRERSREYYKKNVDVLREKAKRRATVQIKDQTRLPHQKVTGICLQS